jgi:hypothetical protein
VALRALRRSAAAMSRWPWACRMLVKQAAALNGCQRDGRFQPLARARECAMLWGRHGRFEGSGALTPTWSPEPCLSHINPRPVYMVYPDNSALCRDPAVRPHPTLESAETRAI